MNDNWQFAKIDYSHGMYHIYALINGLWYWNNSCMLLRDAIAWAQKLEDSFQAEKLKGTGT